MRFTASKAERIVAQLEAMPPRLASLTAGISDSRLRQPPGEKGWSAVDIRAHLRACADVWGHSIYAMLAATDPALPDIDERKWARAARYVEAPFEESLQAYSLQRGSLIRVCTASLRRPGRGRRSSSGAVIRSSHKRAVWQSMSRNTAGRSNLCYNKFMKNF